MTGNGILKRSEIFLVAATETPPTFVTVKSQPKTRQDISMTRTSSLTLSVAVLMASLGAFATPVFAQAQNTETNQRPDMFERFDADGDGAVTREEMQQARAAAKEAREARQSQNQGRPGGKPGVGAKAPFQQAGTHRRPDMFERFDADGDGAVTREEMQQARATAKEAREDRQSRNHGRPGGKPGAGAKAAFQQADTDSDGALSRSELLARHESRIDQMIERLDADEDGLLSPEEMRDGFGKRHPGPRR